jgi:hypothetical protein
VDYGFVQVLRDYKRHKANKQEKEKITKKLTNQKPNKNVFKPARNKRKKKKRRHFKRYKYVVISNNNYR